MNFKEIISYLASRNLSRYSLDNLEIFVDKVGFVFDIPVIHVTGTNGKGSTVRYISSIYAKAAYKVGSYTSPHRNLLDMITVDGNKISEQDVENIFNSFFEDFKKFGLSEFEIQTIICLEFFKRQNIDICVIEVGMGGEIDATNIVTSTVLSVITKVNMEHGQYLGRSESEIAKNKAGIIKDSSPVLTLHQNENIELAIREVARKKKSQIHFLQEYCDPIIQNENITFNYSNLINLKINTLAVYQIENACTAIEAVRILSNKFPVSEQNIRDGLLSPVLPGRFTVLNEYPNILIDGAHNPSGIEVLVKTIVSNGLIIDSVLFAAFKDKNIDKMLSYLGTDFSRVILTTFNNMRARAKDDYFLFAEEYEYNHDFRDILEHYINTPDKVLLICGSLDFAYEVIDYLKSRKK